MQRGTIIKHRRSWTLLYYDTVIRNGERKRIRVSKKLAVVSKEFPTKTSVKPLADKILTPLNLNATQPESSLLVTQFIEKWYFPVIEVELRPSTVLNYRVSIYEKHLKDRLGKMKLRDARPVHFQRMLREVASATIGPLTLLHIKNFLSGVFKFAKREGILDGMNPLTDVTVPGRAKKFHGKAHTLDEIDQMVEDLSHLNDPTAIEVIGLLSLTGLRQSEARGLRWSDWNEIDETLDISRSVWGSHVGPTKNPESENSIPVLPMLKNLLSNRRERLKPGTGDYIFAGSRRNQPLNFHNLESRVIRPALKAFQLPESEKDVGWKTSPIVEWKGFHGFRRGLATNLFELGVHPKTIAAILRHSDVNTTLKHYIKERDTESRSALATLEARIKARYDAIPSPRFGSQDKPEAGEK